MMGREAGDELQSGEKLGKRLWEAREGGRGGWRGKCQRRECWRKWRGEKALEERRRGRAGLRGGLAAAECAAFQYLMTPKYSH